MSETEQDPIRVAGTVTVDLRYEPPPNKLYGRRKWGSFGPGWAMPWPRVRWDWQALEAMVQGKPDWWVRFVTCDAATRLAPSVARNARRRGFEVAVRMVGPAQQAVFVRLAR